ncbi:nuclease domain-containing protein [Burkholderia gladioli]|uniref:nuclease domain-containing protein n=1 Tax=Burkholderia gladioli TaxID=28095 RepID=UPI00163E992B|nr:nuclease domain-containing protein [Burkholderia gladioli]
MKRSGFNRKPGSPFSSLTRTSTLKRQKAIVKRVKRPTVAEGSKYLAACRGEPCYLRVPGICWLLDVDYTVVPCHSNQAKHGKGMGIKANHEFTVPGCRACHAWIDQGAAPRAQKIETWDRGYAAWVPVRAYKMGLEVACAI